MAIELQGIPEGLGNQQCKVRESLSSLTATPAVTLGVPRPP